MRSLRNILPLRHNKFSSQHYSAHVMAVILLLGIALITGYIAGGTIQKHRDNKLSVLVVKTAQDKYRQNSAQLEKMLQEKEFELTSCIEDRATIESTRQQPYDFKDFKVASPLFEGKQMGSTVYTYKGSKIIHHMIDEGGLKPNWRVDVWIVADKFPSTRWENSNGFPDFPVFDGYENYGNHPVFLSERTKTWDNSLESYRTSNDLVMHYIYNFIFFGYNSTSLAFFSPYTTIDNPVYVEITVQNDDYTTDKNSLIVQKAKERLKEIADTINVIPYHS